MPIASIAWLVDRCRRHAAWVAAAMLLATVGLAIYAAERISIDANEAKLISENRSWRQREKHFDTLFPQTVDVLVVVIDGATPEAVEAAAGQLSDRLAGQHDLFISVQRPDAGAFFRKNGLLFLDAATLAATSDTLIKAQPMLGSLSADPSLRGLFGMIDLAVQGAVRGQADPAALSPLLSAVTAAMKGALAGTPVPISWEHLLTGREPLPRELRRFILVKPKLDYGELEPGGKASAAIRAAATALGITPAHGLRLRLTGSVALDDDEFASVKQGAALSLSLSVVLVLVFLYFALRSLRLILAVIVTLVAGLVWTAAFATFAVGALNVISVAFAVMFLGIAVDFAIQFTVRYRQERYLHGGDVEALRATAMGLGKPLLLAATTTALGFLSFAPTAYRGVAELGFIAAAGMIVAVLLTFTLLPALLSLIRPSAEPEPVGFAWAAAVDRLLLRRRREVLAIAGVLAIASLAALPWVRFDFNPLHLKDPKSESMSTLLDLMDDPATTPYTVDALAPSATAAKAIASQLSTLPQVAQVETVNSFIPEDQAKKLATLADLKFFLDPALHPVAQTPAPGMAEQRASAAALLAALREFAEKVGPVEGHADLADALDAALKRDDAGFAAVAQVLVPGLVSQLAQVREALLAEPVDLATLPPDLLRSWVAPDGEARIAIAPTGDMRDNAALVAFTQAVQRVLPEAIGTPIAIQESGSTVAHAFLVAGAAAIVTITIVLFLFLRRIRDVLLVLAPLALAGLLTMSTGVLVGLPLNFANVIALPLLLGVGVAFDIYFVIGWRQGSTNLLQSATARAVLFSALTTTGAFGTLALSPHRGTAEMGILLTMALCYALLTTLLFLPALVDIARAAPKLDLL
jgi:hopanoid biosynthesis associated RND transporter like protein HpnN